MTPEDILKLEAGLELDTLIAEKVMEEPKPTPITANDLRAQERVTVTETTCKTCGKPFENKTKRLNPRQFCNSSCRNKHWSAMRAGRETVEIKPKKEPGPKLTNWERILAKRDPITHRYNNAPVLAPIKREV